ncbi:phage tail protein [Providencia alcalifaciens]|uniref:phage tail-collar fiber domain-containing protein n=1 Tax=Providencia alcalifaciens TaxID=126385 RepID=UPI001E430B07|nr:phage tail protein [Providencia alcalifaciens]
MKYFALLTKLGENLLAQATALGTKLELTHMAVGDGGGSLPTPDTNQTKLIAEKRRAAINTLFIDDKNKNQIIAEQIIPEQDGGWWIREIGLFDKAGNLIAMANCPETYKPQLAEGSGRTQSIRMVLVVSHTESVTLKIDPSVVLATREYVNTEITVLDKKIDALSAQTKLDLNKKFDKANISGQKGNDNDKVPSLNLFTTEIGKLAVIGYSYSKIESDGRYQPKGNYAPAGDYATNTALNNGLDKKFDKTGGQFNVDGEGVALRNTTDNRGLTLGFRDKGNILRGYLGFPSELNRLSLINSKTGKALSLLEDGRLTYDGNAVMTVGDFGLGKTSGVMLPQSGVVVSDYRINGTAYVYSSGQDSDTYQKGNHTLFNIFGHVTGNYGAQLAFPITGKNDFGFRIIHNNNVLDWCSIYHSGNTQADHNGNVKIPGYLERSDYPVGAPIPWPQATAPAGFLVCNGQSFNKITYPLLAKAYPTGVLPDLRGEFLRGLDAGRGVDSGRAVLSAQGDAFRAHNHSVIGEDSGSGTAYFGRGNGSRRAISKDAMNLEGGTETRPRNIAFLYIVRAA